LGHCQLRQEDSIGYWWLSTSSPNGSVKPVTFPKADRVLDFLDELVHRYGLPHRIITDLGSNFNNHQFWEYCENSGIDVRYVSVAHPRANGQVERANGMVLDALKKRLHGAANSKGGKCIKELPNALWGLRTQPSKPTGQSPYFLVYGSEAILPADVIWNSPAVEHYDKGVSEDSRRADIDSLEEARCAALVQSARYLEGIRRYHDRTSRNDPSTLEISSSAVSRTRKDYTSSAPPGRGPSPLQR
jgi:hypothetical protein